MFFEQNLFQDPILAQKYDFFSKLGQGCFGKIYKVKNKALKIFTALKIQVVVNLGKKSMLQNEAQILKTLKGKPLVPHFYSFGQWKLGTYLQIQLMSMDLSTLFEKCFNLQQISNLTVKLLQSLNVLHNCQVIHQDIKPQNIMINLKGEYVFIDFGISQKLKDIDQNLKKNINKKIKGFVGTPRYASIQAHMGLEQSKKDDLESLFYNIAYLYLKKLPWLSLKVNGGNRIQQIKSTKLKTGRQVFCQMGKTFQNSFQYIKKLDHLQQPNYKHLISIFKRSHTVVVDPTKKGQQEINDQNIVNTQVLRRSDNKKYSLHVNFNHHNKGRYLQLPLFMNKNKIGQIDHIYQKSIEDSNVLTSSNNSSTGASKGISMRVYHEESSINEEMDILQKDVDFSQFEEQKQWGVLNIAKFFSPIEMKNPFFC